MEELEYQHTDYDKPSELLNSITDTLCNGAPEARLLLEVMSSAVKCRDAEYFRGHVFKTHCELIGLDHKDIMQKITKCGLISGYRKSKYKRNSAKVRGDIKRKRFVHGLTLLEIANEYGVTVGTVSRALKSVDD